MVFRIDDFKAEVSKAGGFAMGNLFRVLLPPLRDDSRSMSIICKAASLPGRQLTSTEYQKGIYTSKIAYGYLVDDVTLTFHLLNDYKVKTYFEYFAIKYLKNTSTTVTSTTSPIQLMSVPALSTPSI